MNWHFLYSEQKQNIYTWYEEGKSIYEISRKFHISVPIIKIIIYKYEKQIALQKRTKVSRFSPNENEIRIIIREAVQKNFEAIHAYVEREIHTRHIQKLKSFRQLIENATEMINIIEQF